MWVVLKSFQNHQSPISRKIHFNRHKNIAHLRYQCSIIYRSPPISEKY